MLEMRLYNNSLTVEYDKKNIPNETTFCLRHNMHCIAYNYNIQYDLTTIKIKDNFKKNFKIIPLRKNYIIYNEKNQAIIDIHIFNIVNHFDIEEINPDLLEMLYKLEFIISA